jgi:hypothetical protein
MAFDARTLISNTYCLQEISKNVEGEVTILDRIQKPCSNPPCETLTLIQHLHLILLSLAECDSTLGAILDGEMQVGNLTTVFTGLQEVLRGVHAADFYWKPYAGGAITAGTLQGITNAGIVRPPPFQTCESCREVGVLTGHLFATGTHVPGIPVPDFYVDAVYRLAWDPIAQVKQTAPVRGTLEGVIIMPCQ